MIKNFIISSLIFILLPLAALQAGQITVSKKGPVKSIKEAILGAEKGDTIFVTEGIYSEGNIAIDKSITLTGVNNPVIDGKGGGEIFTIQADHVVIEGFIIRNVENSYVKDHAGIRIMKSKGCIIRNNILRDTYFAIYLENSDSCTVANNVVEGQAQTETSSGNAIHLWYCKNINIINNQVSGHRDGVYLEFVESSFITGNTSKNNLRYGLHFMFSNDNVYKGNRFIKNGAGVAVMYSKRIQMYENHFISNQGPASYGILLKDITDSRIEQNVFSKNTIAFLAEGSNRLTVNENSFNNNGWGIKIMGSCEALIFKRNNFSGNTFEVGTNSKNISGHLFENNFWSSYTGYDLDKDGIGDVPHQPVRLFSYMVEQIPTSVVLIRSLFVELLELAEKVTPSLTPATLADNSPQMKINNWQNDTD